MIKLEPPVTAVPLSMAATGSVIQFGAKVGICAITARRDKIMVSYDAANSSFVYDTANLPSEVLVLGGELILKPALGSTFENVRPESGSTNELFIEGDKAKVVIHLGTDFRLLDVSTGELEASQRSPLMSGFRKWSLGVYIQGAASPTFVELLSV